MALHELRTHGQKIKADFIRFEPTGQTTAENLRMMGALQTDEVQPANTLVVDLSMSEDELRSGLASGHRNPINGTARRGIVVKQSDSAQELKSFTAMLDDTARRAGVHFYPPEYYEKLIETIPEVARLYMAYVDNNPIAGALFYDFGQTRYYAHAGAFQELNRQYNASVSLVWQSMMDAKGLGFKRFDLWGVAPTDDPHHPWAGISRFKRGFGGRPVDYLGTWDLPLKPMKYRAYRIYRKLAGRL
jgi:lipid II:glycine glycyltransferase (peptidoglycan interpeptide bridge formation enzyme)